MTRKAWQPQGLRIFPTNSSFCCLMLPFGTDEIDVGSIRWNPTANDLSANDWIV